LHALVPVLEQEFRAAQGWDRLKTDSERWSELLNDIAEIKQNPPPPEETGDRDRKFSRILLSDQQRHLIIGSAEQEDQPQLVPINVDGSTVGWLGLKKRRPFRSGPPAALLERQAKHLTLLGGVVLILTALVAFLFSRHLIKPIRNLTKGTRVLAERNFSVRIEPTTRDELGQLAENFNEMARTLGHYETMRRQWLTDISHELRTPLTVLRGELEAIQDGIRTPSPDNLASLHGEIIRLGKLVEDLHQLSLAESDTLVVDRRRLAPVTILSAALDSYRNLLRQQGIETGVELADLESVTIKGDGARLSQVFTNILDNVCKYVQAPGHLTITGRSTDGVLELRFADSGPGVPPDALPRLFDRLFRVEGSRNRSSGGSGLGLAICRHIIEQHGGTIRAEPSELGGLAIVIALPLASRNLSTQAPT
ncbi:MAG: HAMP domain-containing protein, partial [Desulfofustis sp.]|nr:HAMP domain-containing protein [Desulfofustis sp.]